MAKIEKNCEVTKPHDFTVLCLEQTEKRMGGENIVKYKNILFCRQCGETKKIEE